MCKLNLLPHNQSAYEKVMEHFKTHQKAAVVHATGTGKSYIIGAVCEHFKKVLVVAPNCFVLNETQKVCDSNVEFRTYASVMCDKSHETDYDLLVFDEMHRAGAPEWNKGVLRLIDANPNAKLFGLSATHIRYLDNNRDMADELFDGNVVSSLPLGNALSQGILPTPTYVSSIYEIEESVRKAKNMIKKSSHLTDDEKDSRLRRLSGISNSWEESHGVPTIIRKYFDKDMKRIIVFCSKVKKASEARKLLGSWFASAGYKRIRFYNIDYKEKFIKKEMADFQEPVEEGTLKVAISVNMLNEGVHVPRVDGVIMLRSTISRIIIEQQVGRCLTTNNNGRTPIVLDLVNNMDTICDPFGDGYSFENSTDKSYSRTPSNIFPFKIIDECRDFHLFYEQIESSYKENLAFAFERYYNEAVRFKNENGRLPDTTDNRALYLYMSKFRLEPYFSRYPEQVKKWAEIGYNMTLLADRFDIYVQECIDFLKKHGKTPTVRVSNTSSEEKKLGLFMKRIIKNKNEEQLLTLVRNGLILEDSEEMYLFIEEQKKKGNLPSNITGGRKPWLVQFEEAKEYISKNGFPVLRSKEGKHLSLIHNTLTANRRGEINKERVRLIYEANLIPNITPRVAKILKECGINIDADYGDYEKSITRLVEKYGSFENARKKDNLTWRRQTSGAYHSLPDEIIIEFINKGWYSTRLSECRKRISQLQEKGLIPKEIDCSVPYTIGASLSDEQILEGWKKLGHKPRSHKNSPDDEESILYRQVRNRWRKFKLEDVPIEKIMWFIDNGLYFPNSQTFKDVINKYHIKLTK